MNKTELTTFQKRRLNRQKQKRQQQLKRGLFFLIGLLSLFGIYTIITTHTLKVKVIIVEPADSTITNELKFKISQAITPTSFYQSYKNNILFIRSTTLERLIRTSYAQIGHVEVKKKYPDTIVIQIQERKKQALFCQQSLCYGIDLNGIVIDQESMPTNQSDILFKTDQLIQTQLGKTSVNSESLDFLQLIRKQIKEILNEDVKIMNIKSLAHDDVRQVEIEIADYHIFMDRETIIGDQLAALKKVFVDQLKPDIRAKVDYIDLRVPNRVYYKLKE